MPDINVHDLDAASVPFFVRYLEGQSKQLTEAEMDAVRGGNTKAFVTNPDDFKKLADEFGTITNKFPSDEENFDPLFPNLIPLEIY